MVFEDFPQDFLQIFTKGFSVLFDCFIKFQRFNDNNILFLKTCYTAVSVLFTKLKKYAIN